MFIIVPALVCMILPVLLLVLIALNLYLLPLIFLCLCVIKQVFNALAILIKYLIFTVAVRIIDFLNLFILALQMLWCGVMRRLAPAKMALILKTASVLIQIM